MRFVADSSLLVRLYLHDRNSEAIERFLAEDAKVVSLSAWLASRCSTSCCARKAEPANFLPTWTRAYASAWNRLTGPRPFSRPRAWPAAFPWPFAQVDTTLFLWQQP